jgi:hypothetical protein
MIFALERLRALRAGRPLVDLDVIGLEGLPMDWRIEYEERAAILEYDGGLTREEAEAQALREINARLKNAKKR